jgi:hypothetical protein
MPCRSCAVAQLFSLGIVRMAKTLKVQLTTPNPLSVQGLVSDFRIFGEDVYSALRNECDVSIHEICASISEFHLRGLHKREVRAAASKVRKIIEKHHWLPPINIYEIPEDHDA